MIALIDGDILLYRVGFTTENEEEWIARARMDDLIDSILVEVDATGYELWVSDDKDGNFRFQVSDTYHANRTKPRPRHYDVLKEHLIKQWGCRIAFGMEADDMLGIQQDDGRDPDGGYSGPPETWATVICSIDKDLLQIPGNHWNFVKKEWKVVEPWEGLKWFYKQILIGDSADNVQGCEGIGPAKAGKALDGIPVEAGEGALFRKVVKTYLGQEGPGGKAVKKIGKEKSLEEVLSHIRIAGRLLKIKTRESEELWDFPEPYPTTETMSLSTPPKPEALTPSTELTGVEQSGSLPLGTPKEGSLMAATPD